MCKWGTNKIVWLRIPAGLSHTGRRRWKRVKVDACLAPLLRALRRTGIKTSYSCCGHGKGDGLILCDNFRAIVLKGKSGDQDV